MHVRVHARVVCSVVYTLSAESFAEAKEQLEWLNLEGVFSGPAVRLHDAEVIEVSMSDEEITDVFEY